MRTRRNLFSANRWGPVKTKQQVGIGYKIPPGIETRTDAPITKRTESRPIPVLGKKNRLGVSDQTKSKKERAEDRFRIEHELPWVAYNLKGDTQAKPKPKTQPEKVSDPDYFMRPDRYPADLTTYEDANKKTEKKKTSFKTIPKKTPTKEDNEKKEDPLKKWETSRDDNNTVLFELYARTI